MRRSKTQFLAAVLGALYTVYLVSYFGGISDQLAGYLASSIVRPHMLCCALGSVFACVAFFTNNRTMSLIGAIMFCAAAVVFTQYAQFVVPMIILGFIGYARIGSIIKKHQESEESGK